MAKLNSLHGRKQNGGLSLGKTKQATDIRRLVVLNMP